VPGWPRVPGVEQQPGEEGEREAKRERRKKSPRKFARCRCTEQLLLFFSFPLCILGLVKRRGISHGDFFVAQPLRCSGRGEFVASLVPYFAYEIFKAPQKARRGPFKVRKASAILLF